MQTCLQFLYVWVLSLSMQHKPSETWSKGYNSCLVCTKKWTVFVNLRILHDSCFTVSKAKCMNKPLKVNYKWHLKLWIQPYKEHVRRHSPFFLSSGLPFFTVAMTMSPTPAEGRRFRRPLMPFTEMMYRFLAPKWQQVLDIILKKVTACQFVNHFDSYFVIYILYSTWK